VRRPEDVFCPLCLAGPKQSCRGVLLFGKGKPCKPHAIRRAKVSRLKLVRDLRAKA